MRKIVSIIRFWWDNLMSNIFIQKRKINPNQEYVFLVDKARKDWHWANKLIQEVRDDNLIDQTIYAQSAAERKYVYLLKEAAREGIKADLETMVFLALAERNKAYKGVGMCNQNCGRLY